MRNKTLYEILISEQRNQLLESLFKRNPELEIEVMKIMTLVYQQGFDKYRDNAKSFMEFVKHNQAIGISSLLEMASENKELIIPNEYLALFNNQNEN